MQTFVHNLMGQGWVAVGSPSVIIFTFLRVMVIYIVLLGLLKLAGKRTLGQLTPFDLLTLLLLSNVVQNAMIGPDNSLTGGIVGAMVLLGLNQIISRSPLRSAIEGHPTLLIQNGEVMEANLKLEGVSLFELETALREHGVTDPAKVASAVLEVDGTISVVPMQGGQMKRLRRVKSSRNR